MVGLTCLSCAGFKRGTALTCLEHAALDYRQELGGEERIMEYNHNLVLEGAALIANALQTSYMENSEKSLIAAMVREASPHTEWCHRPAHRRYSLLR
jgi:hypothetical protein